MTSAYRLYLLIMGVMLITAQLAPIGMQWMDMEFAEFISTDETEKEEKKEKELEEKEKYASNGISINPLNSFSRGQFSTLSFSLPQPPYMETSSPPPDMFL